MVLFSIWSAISYFNKFWRKVDIRTKQGRRQELLIAERQRRRDAAGAKDGKRCAIAAAPLKRIGRGRRGSFDEELRTFRRQPDRAHLADRPQRFQRFSVQRNRQRARVAGHYLHLFRRRDLFGFVRLSMCR